MWPIDQISGLFYCLTRPRMPELVADQQGFSLSRGKLRERYSWNEVEKVLAFKRDRGTYDEICLQLDIAGRVGHLEVSEEFAGYNAFVAIMEKQLPGVSEDWFSEVAFPAFEENPTTVFPRRS